MRRVRWHAKGKDLVFKAVVLKLLVKVTLVAVQDQLPLPPYLARLGVLVKVIQPFKTKRIVSPAILGD